MLFRELKAGQPIYYFNRDTVTASTCKAVTNATSPHSDIGMPLAPMVVDVQIDINGDVKSFVLPESADTAYPEGAVLSTSRDVILHEMKALRAQAEQALGMMDKHKSVMERCDAQIAEFDPTVKEKQETEERFKNLEGQLSGVNSKIDKLLNQIQSLIS